MDVAASLAAGGGAAEVAETGALLMMPGRAREEGRWMVFGGELARESLAGKGAAEARDSKRMLEAGAAIYPVRTNRHAVYVMPFLPNKTRPFPASRPDPRTSASLRTTFCGEAAEK